MYIYNEYDIIRGVAGSLQQMEKAIAWVRCKVLSVEDGSPRTVNIFLGFFLMINLVLGTGFLSIPFGFFAGGVLAGVLTLLSMTVLSWLCAVWVVETMARSQVRE